MRLKIISKGQASNTRVVDADTGEELKGVIMVGWTTVAGGQPCAHIRLVDTPVEITTDAEIAPQGVDVIKPICEQPSRDTSAPPAIAEDTIDTKESTR